MKPRSSGVWLIGIFTVFFALVFFYFSRTTCIHPHCVELYSKDSITILYSCYLVFLFITAVASILVPRLPYKIRHVLEKDVTVSPFRSRFLRFWWPEGSFLECCAMVAVLGLLIANFILYWNLMLSPSDGPLEAKSYWIAGLMATGHMGDVLLGLVFIPLGRSSFLPCLLDIHIDACLRFHKRCGILIFMVIIAHGAVIWTKATTYLNPPSYTYWTFNIGVQGLKWIFYVSEAGFMTSFGFIAGVALIILWIFTFPTIRRRVYHWFYGVHVIFGPIMIVAACLHTTSIWYYCMPGAFLLLIDWAIRLYNYTIRTKSLATREACGYVRIDIFSTMKVDPGGFVMLRIKELGLQISHPYTVASDPTSDRLILLVKPSASPAEWSYKLGSLVPFGSPSREITVQADGPFGHLKFDISQMDVVACFVGGVGVAGALAIAAEVLNNGTKPSMVFIFWAAREPAAGNLSVLQQLRNRGGLRLCIHLYGTAATALLNHHHPMKEERLSVEVGTNLSDNFQSEPLKYDIQLEGIGGSLDRMIPEILLRREVIPAARRLGKIGIYTCGPKTLMDSVQKACEQLTESMEIYVHRETFEW